MTDTLSIRFTPEDIPSLADPSVVSKLIRDFTSGVMDEYMAFQHSRQTRDQSLASIYDLARECGDIIMGRNPDYDTAEWQNPMRLGAQIRAQEVFSFKSASDPGEVFFRWLATQVIHACKELDDGTAREAVGQKLAATLKSAKNFILGIGV